MGVIAIIRYLTGNDVHRPFLQFFKSKYQQQQQVELLRKNLEMFVALNVVFAWSSKANVVSKPLKATSISIVT